MSEFKGKDKKELLKALVEKKTVLQDISFGTAGSKNKNVKSARSVRKDIARINTELTVLAKSEQK